VATSSAARDPAASRRTFSTRNVTMLLVKPRAAI
jgi:hypothetical protein